MLHKPSIEGLFSHIAISHQKSSDDLHLLVDSTSLNFLGEGEWKCKKHGQGYRRQWRKLHIAIDAETLQIRAIQLTTKNVSDLQVLEDLLSQTPLDEQLLLFIQILFDYWINF